MIIQLMFNGFVALGAPTTIQNVVTGVALLVIVALTTKPVKGLVVKIRRTIMGEIIIKSRKY